MTTRSVRTQLLVGIGGVVMLTVLLFASAVWRLILRPAEDELAARDMRYAATAASAQVRGLVEGVEHIVEREVGLRRMGKGSCHGLNIVQNYNSSRLLKFKPSTALPILGDPYGALR